MAKWRSEMLPKLKWAIKHYDTYTKVSLIFSVTPQTIRIWVKKHLPQEPPKRRGRKAKWRKEYLPKLRGMCNSHTTLNEIKNEFNVSGPTVRRWILEHLGENMLRKVCKEKHVFSPEMQKWAIQMRTAGSTLLHIKQNLGIDISISTLSKRLKYVPCGKPASMFANFSNTNQFDKESADFYKHKEGPTDDELEAIEQGLDIEFLDDF